MVTFDRHPAAVVRPESAPKLLTDLDQKLELLADAGVDYTLVVRFDEERSTEPAHRFVTEVLVDCLGARAVAVGEDFHFGHQRSGNVDLLRAMGTEHDFEVLGLGLVGLEGRRRSTARSRPPGSAGPSPTAPGRRQRDARAAPRGPRRGRLTATSGPGSWASRRPT